jgi:hypothetical protein
MRPDFFTFAMSCSLAVATLTVPRLASLSRVMRFDASKT